MFYPTVQSKETAQIHVVKDEHFCECGLIYNPFSALTKKDLRMIKFREMNQINCQKCRSLFLNNRFSQTSHDTE